MGRFNEYPYVNYNEYNLDWIIKKVKELMLAWIELNKANEKFKDDVNAAIADLKKYIDDYFDNLDIDEEVREAIDAEIELLVNSGYFLNIVGNNAKGITPVSLIAEYSTNTDDTEYDTQSVVYIGNGQYVFYTMDWSNGRSDDGWLVCLDINTKLIVWRHAISLYHANSMCYVRSERKIYAASLMNKDSQPLPYIMVVSIDQPDTVESIITLPTSIQAQSVAYDEITGRFYVGGGTSIQRGVIYEFNGHFDSVNRVIQLGTDSLTQSILDAGQQDCTIVGGVFYQVHHNRINCVVGFDLSDGHITTIANLPFTFSGCKNTFEYEGLTFDTDRNVFVMTNMSQSYRVHGCRIINFCDVGIVQQIPIKYPSLIFTQYTTDNREIHIDVANLQDCTPVTETGIFRGIVDAEYYSSIKFPSMPCRYVIRNSITNDARVSNAFFHNSFIIRPHTGNTLTLFSPDLRMVSSATLRNCTVQGGGAYASNIAMVGVYWGQRLFLENVTFQGNGNGIEYGVCCGVGSYVKILAGCSIVDTTGELVYMQTGGKLDIMNHNLTGGQVANLFHIDNRTTCEINAAYRCFVGSIDANTTEDFVKYGTKQGLLLVSATDYRCATAAVPFSIYDSTDTTQLQPNVLFIPTDDGYIKANFSISWTQIRLGSITKVLRDGTTSSLPSLNIYVTCIPA